MDPRYCAQNILLCDLCQKAALQSHCELCQINLCKACVGEHLSDSSKRHNVVPYKHRKSTPHYPKCPNHTKKHCELYCEKCDIPVCSICISSGEHHGHIIRDILQKQSAKTEDLRKDLKELEEVIYPTYEKIASNIISEKGYLEKHYEKQTLAVIQHGDNWHKEIDTIVNNRKSEIDDMKTKHIAALNEQEYEIRKTVPEIKQNILDLKKILDSNDDFLTSAYKSKNAEFRDFPSKIKASLPSFCFQRVNSSKIDQMFGFTSALSITKEYGYTKEKIKTDSRHQVKPLLKEPKLIKIIDTKYRQIYSVSIGSGEEIWTRGNGDNMKLYNLQGKLLKSIQTKSGSSPMDIAVTRNGDLVYTDPDRSTVNIVKNDQIQEVIRLMGWRPSFICCTSSGDLLVTMDSNSGDLSKVVRYSESMQTQTIQFDSKGKPLYSHGNLKYISENRNLDICVADQKASAVVVVNQAGKLRFKYTGHYAMDKELFNPHGITTDSQGQILTADFTNNSIHILDQDGQFLSYIDKCYLDSPWGLCLNIKDNLFVAECYSGQIKNIKYV